MEDWTWRLESPFSLYRKIFESIIETCSERRNVLQNLIGFISEDKEQCGTEKIPLTLIVAKKMIYRNCPQHREHYQRICFIHDLCYGAVLKKTHTKEQCDQSFCDMLSYMTKSTDNNPKCAEVGDNFCAIVQSYNYFSDGDSQIGNTTISSQTTERNPYI
ncbi:unnamed protein product, partial [Mesorhabditis belari]|uniref:Uncharacterized protein n=1 Tax=Mesorhabditis belari TaxID=2138241 RepID=A0AAF3F7T4_9BILA